MVRPVLVAVLLALLCVGLYLPSITPATRYLDLVHAEDNSLRALMGDATADRVLERMLDLQQYQSPVSVPPAQAQARSTVLPGYDRAAVEREAARVYERLFGNPYFKAIDAQFALVTYRASMLIEFWMLLVLAASAALVDGLVVRVVRYKELVPPSPEAFGASAVLATLMAAAVAIGAFLPVEQHPVVATALLLGACAALSRAAANYSGLR